VKLRREEMGQTDHWGRTHHMSNSSKRNKARKTARGWPDWR